MTSERPTRSRQGSNAIARERGLSIHLKNPSRHTSKPKSTHTSDPFLADFLSPSFDPADYLNNILPPLQNPGPAISSKSGQQPVSLTELASQAQTLTSQLNAHTTRLSDTLTHLTDDILRSGSRLAYEVELLRGEALGLTEAITEGLQDDIKEFFPGGLQDVTEARGGLSPEARAHQRRLSVVPSTPTPRTAVPQTPKTAAATPAVEEDLTNEPVYVQELCTLTVARSRLDQVIKTFGDAMEFVFPPSEMSVSSSFLSVSAPEPGSAQQSSEEKGQEVLRAMRREISELLADADDPVRGIEKAAQRVGEIKDLTTVWRGTAEEKGRARFVESLAKMVEDKHRELLKEMDHQRARREESEGRPRKGSLLLAADSPGGTEPRASTGGYGILQRIRGGL